MTRDEMMSRMSSEEFYHWMVLEKIEPFGEFGDWLRTGIVSSIIANVNRGKDRKAFKPEDFMPKFEADKPQGPEEFYAALMALKTSQDAFLKSKAKREQARADANRNRELRSKTKGPRAHRPAKSAR